jgi:hypothetical protein
VFWVGLGINSDFFFRKQHKSVAPCSGYRPCFCELSTYYGKVHHITCLEVGEGVGVNSTLSLTLALDGMVG